MNLNGKNILITGGTGSFGRKFVAHVLHQFPGIGRLVIYSRDEQKQYLMAEEFSTRDYPQLRYFIGDVRDPERLIRAFKGIDYVIHAAAIKHVPIAEYNPGECVKTNIMGAENVINAAFASNVSKVVALSTDKAAAPINLYGATKLASDKLFIAANNIKGSQDINFCVVRYGNVMGSNGSVIPYFLKKRKDGVLPITHPEMTRFNITLQEGVDMVLHALEHTKGGEIYVPKLPSYRITDVAEAIAPYCEHKIVGIRPGEKIHEEMITSSDSYNTYDLGKYYVILPTLPLWDVKEYIRIHSAVKVKEGFCYNSATNTCWHSVQDIRNLIIKHIDSSFHEAYYEPHSIR